MFGLTDNGFNRKTFPDIVESMQMSARELFGDDINLSDSSYFGMLLQVVAWDLKDIWQMGEDVYYSSSVDSAEGISLDGVGKYISITRRLATKSHTMVRITGQEGTLVPRGLRVSTPRSQKVFQTITGGQIPSTGYLDLATESVDYGEDVNLPTGSITSIVNPIAGIREVTNTVPAIGGENVESDVDFRRRYYRSLSRGGSATREAIESAILEVDNVIDCFVEENVTMETVGGIPPKSVAPFVFGGDDIEIAKTILLTKAGGIQSFGNTVIDVEDSNGKIQKIGFTKPTEMDIYVKVKVYNDGLYVDENELKNSVIDYIGGKGTDNQDYRGLGLGKKVILTSVLCSAKVTNVIDVEVQLSKDNLTWVSTNIDIGVDEIARSSPDKVVIEYA